MKNDYAVDCKRNDLQKCFFPRIMGSSLSSVDIGCAPGCCALVLNMSECRVTKDLSFCFTTIILTFTSAKAVGAARIVSESS